jgi:DNA polymerase delta subunit 2
MHDSASQASNPIHPLSDLLADISHSMPIHLLAGPSDPSGIILPQQPLPRAMFRDAASFGSFSCETNPTYIRIALGTESDRDDRGQNSGTNDKHSISNKAGGRREFTRHENDRPRTILVNSGQPLADLMKYTPNSSPSERLDMAALTLRWRHIAPTAPDTLWCHPFFTTDPFVLHKTPDIYVIGCQPEFASRLVQNETSRCRVVLVPSFSESGMLVLVGLRSLSVKVIRFSAKGM